MRSNALEIGPGGLGRSSKRLLGLRADDHLVARVRRGDAVAFEVLYERHVAGILSFSRHMLGSREEAEDAVQQVFSSAHGDLVRGDREIAFKPWLYTIARNRCLSMLRSRRDEHPAEVDPSISGLHEEVQRRADLRELVADLQDLPDEQRAALVLVELRDLSHAEVAAVLGREERSVKGLVFRARSGLAERREAREADCEEIRAELAVARGGMVRKGRLRHHLKACPACAAFKDDTRGQTRMLALVLPVAPTLGLKSSVLGSLGFGGGAGAAVAGASGLAGGALSAGGSFAGATVAKLAVVGALAGGAGIAGKAAVDDEPSSRSVPTPVRAAPAPAGAGPTRERGERSPGIGPVAPRGARPVQGRGAGQGDRRTPGSGDEGRRAASRRGARNPGRGSPGFPPRSRGIAPQGDPGGAARGRPADPGLAGGRSGAAPPGRDRSDAAPGVRAKGKPHPPAQQDAAPPTRQTPAKAKKKSGSPAAPVKEQGGSITQP